ncbi:unnamed protein product [Urochloa humidicola]
MQLPLRRALSATASASLLRCGLSTATLPPRPPWAMIHQIALVKSADLNPWFLQTNPRMAPSCSSPTTSSTRFPASAPTPRARASSSACSGARACSIISRALGRT